MLGLAALVLLLVVGLGLGGAVLVVADTLRTGGIAIEAAGVAAAAAAVGLLVLVAGEAVSGRSATEGGEAGA